MPSLLYRPSRSSLTARGACCLLEWRDLVSGHWLCGYANGPMQPIKKIWPRDGYYAHCWKERPSSRRASMGLGQSLLGVYCWSPGLTTPHRGYKTRGIIMALQTQHSYQSQPSSLTTPHSTLILHPNIFRICLTNKLVRPDFIFTLCHSTHITHILEI